MPIPVDRDEVQRLVAEEAAQVVEVLPVPEYEDEHIAGAISIPLKGAGREGAAATRPRAPGNRLLLRLPVRHERTSRGAAPDTRFHPRLRLRPR